MAQLARVVESIRRLVGVGPAETGSDAELLARFIDLHDENAFRQLVERHGPMVRGVCQRVLQHDHDADDVCQATFLVLARKAGAIRKYGSVASWLYGTAYRLALKLRAGSHKRLAREAQASLSPEDTAVSPRQTLDLDRHELRALLDEELNRLPEKYRAPLVLCYLEGRTNEEAAAQLQWTKGTVSGRLARARELLRSRLNRRGVVLPAATIATVLNEQLAAASMPVSMIDATTNAAATFAFSKTTCPAIPGRITELAEGALKSMRIAKLKIAAAVCVAVGLLATAVALVPFRNVSEAVPVPREQTPEEAKGKTEPASCPLEMRLVAKQREYGLTLAGYKSKKEYRQALANVTRGNFLYQVPKAPAVDLVLEIKNTGTKEQTFLLGGNLWDYVAVPRLEGPGAVSVQITPPYKQRAMRLPRTVKLPAGATHQIPVTDLSSRGPDDSADQNNYWFSHWTEPGEYRLSFTLKTAVQPEPEGSERVSMPDKKDYGLVKLTSNTVTLKVEEGKTEPASCPLEMRLVAQKRDYILGLAGYKSKEEYRKALQGEKGPAHKAPAVDLMLEIKNNGAKEQTFLLGGNLWDFVVVPQLAGPGAITVHSTPSYRRRGMDLPRTIKLAAGESYKLPITELRSGPDTGQQNNYWFAHWTEPGSYRLSFTLKTAVLPEPEGSERLTMPDKQDYGLVKLTSNTVTLKVEESKTEPASCPLEMRLLARKSDYLLQLPRGTTGADYRAALKSHEKDGAIGGLPKPPVVDLVLEFRNTGKEELTFLLNGNSPGYVVVPHLQGAGAVTLVTTCEYSARALARPTVIKLPPGGTHTLPVEQLRSGSEKEAQDTYWSSYWTEPGEYRIHFSMRTAVRPVPDGSEKIGGLDKLDYGLVKLTSNAVTVQVKEQAAAGSVPAGVPLQLVLTARKDTYKLNLGNKTPEDFRKEIAAFQQMLPGVNSDLLPVPQAVDLQIEIRNTGDQELEVDLAGLTIPQQARAMLELHLDGPGVVGTPISSGLDEAKRAWQFVKLGPKQSRTFLWTTLEFGDRGRHHRLWWTERGDYTLSATFRTAVSPVPAGAKPLAGVFQGFGAVTLSSNPVTIKIE